MLLKKTIDFLLRPDDYPKKKANADYEFYVKNFYDFILDPRGVLGIFLDYSGFCHFA